MILLAFSGLVASASHVGGATVDDEAVLIGQVEKRIMAAWKLPPKSDGRKVTLRYTLARNGSVSLVRVEKSSGNQSFDDSAVQAVRRASPFPSPLKSFPIGDLRMVLDPTLPVVPGKDSPTQKPVGNPAMNEFDEAWWKSVEDAIGAGQQITNGSAELNMACDHIVQLLKDASLLLETGSCASAVFLSITALEETAKIHIGNFRRAAEVAPRKKDPLFKHGKKHQIAAAPTIAMGSRLQRAIGEYRMREITELAKNGRLVSIREDALYIEKRDGQLQVPSQVISKDLARGLLLFAVEAFDDAFVGCTHHSFELEKITDQIFARWENVR